MRKKMTVKLSTIFRSLNSISEYLDLGIKCDKSDRHIVFVSILKPKGNVVPLIHRIYFNVNETNCDCKFARYKDDNFIRYCCSVNMFNLIKQPGFSVNDLGISCSDKCPFYRKSDKLDRIVWVTEKFFKTIEMKRRIYVLNNPVWNGEGKPEGHHIVKILNNGNLHNGYYVYVKLHNLAWMHKDGYN